MSFLELKNISYKIEENIVLNNISFDIKKGDFVSIIGLNGSGKTTLSLIISGIKEQTNGQIYFNQKKITSHQQIGKIGIIFQNPDNQILGSTVKENIAFSLENKNTSPKKIEELINFSLKELDILHLKERDPYLLSGGEKQKVSIAEQIALGYEVIILDEPTSLLDPISRNDFLKIIKNLNKKGKTIIYITQDIEEVVFFGSKLLVLEKGNLIYNGNYKKFLENQSTFNTFELELSNELNKLNNKYKVTSSWKELVKQCK